MNFLKEHTLGIILSLVACGVAISLVWKDNWLAYAIPMLVVFAYALFFETRWLFLSLFLLTPISINLEEYVEGIGLFIPTEPMLAAFTILAALRQLHKPFIPSYLFRSPLLWLMAAYLCWLLISSTVSSHPLVSIKFLIAKLWFVVPLFAFGSVYFESRVNRVRAIWLFTIGMTLAMIYTLVVHASYQFGEQEGHWVMSPLFKDHTIYGAMVAFNLPLLVGLYFSKKHGPLVQAFLWGLFVVNMIALYFSYTRAAWLSIVVALGVWAVIKLRIRFSLILGTTVVLALATFFSWTTIQQTLEKNKSEHTTEDFGKRLESVSNVTTDASNLERLNRWACAIDMFVERPVFGFGPGTYAFEYARFQRPENLTIISTNFGNLGNAHSEYLGPLAETGLIGFLLVVGLVAYLFYLGITLYVSWDPTDRESRSLIMAMILALVTYFFHGLLNNYLDTDKASVPIWGIAAMFIVLKNQRLLLGKQA
ncbi:MAG: O-antigen ligase family protein [Bacteroidetes bacterium]|nr:MAG: O-antigen ligase family protein [Bacteroidota bacterium]